MTTTTLSRRFFYLLAACIIALQAVLLVFTIRQKQEFHIDEIYSFILSNSYDTNSFNNADWMWGTWVDQTDFDEFATVQQGEQFIRHPNEIPIPLRFQLGNRTAGLEGPLGEGPVRAPQGAFSIRVLQEANHMVDAPQAIAVRLTPDEEIARE